MTQFNAKTEGKSVVSALVGQVEGRTFLITGPSAQGLGAEVALTLAGANPKKIILAGRNESKITPVIEQIKNINPNIDVSFVSLDLCDNKSVRKAAETINTSVDHIDVLINNAGIMAVQKYTLSADGIESQFAANHIGHFLLTNLIMEKILAAKGATIVNVASGGYIAGEVNHDDPNFDDGKTYNLWTAYGAAKTANIQFTIGLAARLKSKGVAVFAAHPGMVIDTQLQSNQGLNMGMLMDGFKLATERNEGKPIPHEVPKTLQQGCATILYTALDPTIRDESSAFFVDCAPFPTKEYASSLSNAEKLWVLSEKLVGQTFPT